VKLLIISLLTTYTFCPGKYARPQSIVKLNNDSGNKSFSVIIALNVLRYLSPDKPYGPVGPEGPS
jgi:hypothetical protein